VRDESKYQEPSFKALIIGKWVMYYETDSPKRRELNGIQGMFRHAAIRYMRGKGPSIVLQKVSNSGCACRILRWVGFLSMTRIGGGGRASAAVEFGCDMDLEKVNRMSKMGKMAHLELLRLARDGPHAEDVHRLEHGVSATGKIPVFVGPDGGSFAAAPRTHGLGTLREMSD
jgi:hypothetical protein